MTGYTLTNAKTCQETCTYPCSSCDASNPSICLSCVAGYVYDESQFINCRVDTSCNSNGTCSLCPFAYVLTVSNGTQTC
jgi:hypothetical protein